MVKGCAETRSYLSPSYVHDISLISADVRVLYMVPYSRQSEGTANIR
jgi:hypothetical protein